MTTLKIKVTKDILERSKMCNSNFASTNCAIALSIKSIFPDAQVFATTIKVEPMIPHVILPLPAREFIRTFDVSNPNERVLMPELEFEIEVPDSAIEKINIDELRPLLENHPTLELVN